MKPAHWSICAVLILGLAVVSAPTNAEAKSFKVHPGESIQAAVDAASPGDKVIVYPGTYTEPHGSGPGVRVNKSLKMIAKSKPGNKVILMAGAGQTDGILVEPDMGEPDIDGFQIKGFTVQGFPDNGIHLRYVQNFKIDKNESIDNLENGIFPTLSANGSVKKNVSYGSEDSALWVEASENVRVMKNVLHSSPTGLEITVSNNVEAKKNEVYNNTTGVGLYHPSAASLPPLATNANWVITKNHIYDNNLPNPAPPGSMSAGLPAGGGILVLGVDQTIITKNLVEDNDFYGIAMIDYCLAVAGTDFNCDDLPPAVEPYPDYNAVEGNDFINNGTNPDPGHPLAFLAADMTYLVLDSPHYNCYAKNTYSTLGTLGGGWTLLSSGSCL